MPTRKYISVDVREQILQRIRSGIPAAQAAKEHGINPKTVYNWLSRADLKDTSLLEISRLKRQVAELQQIIGELMLDHKRLKKNQRG